LALGLFGAVTVGAAETATITTEKTQKTTSYSGVMSDFNPGASTFMLKSESAATPVSYTYTKTTVFVDAQGNTVSSETIKNSPVTVEYTKDGDKIVVTRVTSTRTTTTK
jgi:hypothetical protein